MLSEFQQRKLIYLFRLYDVNGNQVLEKDDFEMAAKSWGKNLGLEVDSVPFALLLEKEVGLWERIVNECDENLDGKVTLEEFCKGFAGLLRKREDCEHFLKQLVEVIFAAMDRNGDQQIAPDEFVPLMNPYSRDRETAQEIFKVLDTDANGYLSKDELFEHWLTFLYSDNPEDPGNLVFGEYQYY